jgi:hypothetical protein
MRPVVFPFPTDRRHLDRLRISRSAAQSDFQDVTTRRSYIPTYSHIIFNAIVVRIKHTAGHELGQNCRTMPGDMAADLLRLFRVGNSAG